MKKLFFTFFTMVLAMALAATNSFALPAAKATAQFVDLQCIDLGGEYVTVLSQQIKTPNQKDLFIDTSFEVGLVTSTAVMSKKLERAIANAEAQVKVKVLIDGEEADPGEVVFSKRIQTLVAEFAGLYDLWTEDGDPACYSLTYACVDQDPLAEPDSDPSDGCDTGTQVVTGISFSYDDACFDAEFIQLIIDTMAAHSFNFIAADVPNGIHTIEVQVMLDYDLGDGVSIYDRPDLADEVNSYSMSGSSACVGKGSVTIESVRMIKNEDVEGEIPEID